MHGPSVHRLIHLKLLQDGELARHKLHPALAVLNVARPSVRPVGHNPVKSPIRAVVGDDLPIRPVRHSLSHVALDLTQALDIGASPRALSIWKMFLDRRLDRHRRWIGDQDV